MNKKTLIVGTIVIIAALAGSFYGGMSYGKNSSVSSKNFMNNGQMPRGGGFRNGNGANLTNGEIIAKDGTSITVKLRDGGSKIIFYSSSSEIGKFMDGTIEDLEIGKNVMVNGKTNPDGSITAQSIQIRPKIDMPPPPAVPTGN